MATDGDDISIRSTEEMEKYESLCHQEFGHSCVYDVILLERVRMDEELPLILWTIGWGLGKTLQRGFDDSSDGWMTLQPCKQECKHPSTLRPA
jgi:hypothetical protein